MCKMQAESMFRIGLHQELFVVPVLPEESDYIWCRVET